MRALVLFEATQLQGLMPNAIAHSSLLSVSEKGEQPKQALKLFVALQWQRMVPGVITYYALISA